MTGTRGGDLSALIADRSIGSEIYAFAQEIFPLFRSVSGEGSRETFARMAKHVDLTVHEVASGTQVFDWTVPAEWRIEEAYIEDALGKRVLDVRNSNLHVVSYSSPAEGRLPLSELKKHIHTLPEHPDLVPYVTSFFKQTWGFCMAHAALEALPDGEYAYKIDAALFPGSMSYAEYLHPGALKDEILVFAHSCHPSLANDNCSGLAVSTMMAKHLKHVETRFSYRFVWAPTTIGSIAWLARNENAVAHLRGGLALACVGDAAPPSYKLSRGGEGLMDRAMKYVCSVERPGARIQPFAPIGYDERQFNSPAFRIDVGLLSRAIDGEFPQYHTSGDNMQAIGPAALGESYQVAMKAISIVERDTRWRSTITKCEPQLGRRGLHVSYSFDREAPSKNAATMWTIAYCDGHNTLLDIAQRSGLSFENIYNAAMALFSAGLLTPV